MTTYIKKWPLSIVAGLLIPVSGFTAVTAEGNPQRDARPIMPSNGSDTKPQPSPNMPKPRTVDREHSAREAYCAAVREDLANREAALDKLELKQLATAVDTQLTELEKRIASHKEWLAKREEFSVRLQDSLIQIYAKMQAESAAPRLSAMPDTTAASILLGLDTRQASAILSEMEALKAAHISSLVAAAADVGGIKPRASAPQARQATQAP
jgi:flagellar motility protein MotE (MotC chaperone)